MSDPTVPPTAPTTENKPPGKLRQMALKIAVALGSAIVVFLIGWFVGRAPIGELRERVETSERRLALVQDRLYTTEAISLIYQTALDLDARNFGTANDRLDEAASILDSVGAAGSALENLRQAVSATDIVVAQNLSQQRAVVLGFARTLQELMSDTLTVPDNLSAEQ
ncbi:MAG: hypothetical protein R3284_00390 [Rubricoccaceae bacterium]|nr:hypothetical protein [Rubricoccaceae bacterium]